MCLISSGIPDPVKKIQLSKFENPICLIKPLINWAASCVATRRAPRGVVQNKRFSQEKGQSKGTLHKRKEEIISRPEHLLGGTYGKHFYHADCVFSLWGMERAHMANYLIGAD